MRTCTPNGPLQCLTNLLRVAKRPEALALRLLLHLAQAGEPFRAVLNEDFFQRVHMLFHELQYTLPQWLDRLRDLRARQRRD